MRCVNREWSRVVFDLSAAEENLVLETKTSTFYHLLRSVMLDTSNPKRTGLNKRVWAFCKRNRHEESVRSFITNLLCREMGVPTFPFGLDRRRVNAMLGMLHVPIKYLNGPDHVDQMWDTLAAHDWSVVPLSHWGAQSDSRIGTLDRVPEPIPAHPPCCFFRISRELASSVMWGYWHHGVDWDGKLGIWDDFYPHAQGPEEKFIARQIGEQREVLQHVFPEQHFDALIAKCPLAFRVMHDYSTDRCVLWCGDFVEVYPIPKGAYARFPLPSKYPA